MGIREDNNFYDYDFSKNQTKILNFCISVFLYKHISVFHYSIPNTMLFKN